MNRYAYAYAYAFAFAVAMLSFAAAACSSDDDAADSDVIRIDEASDEILLTMRDLVDRGEGVTDDEAAPRMLTPTDGAELSAASPATFTWEHGSSTLRHGRTTGDFVWLSISCAGLAEPIDIIAIETEEWTVDADHWSAITEAALASDSSQCSAALIGAYVDRGVVREGPYLRTANPSYLIIE